AHASFRGPSRGLSGWKPDDSLHGDPGDPWNCNDRPNVTQGRALTFASPSPKGRGVLEGGQTRVRPAARWVPAILLMLAFAVLASIRLDRPGFFDNEGRYAEVAREMLLRRDLVSPEMNDTLFLNKPPLMFWVVAGAFALGAPGEWVRVTCVLTAAVSVLLT